MERLQWNAVDKGTGSKVSILCGISFKESQGLTPSAIADVLKFLLSIMKSMGSIQRTSSIPGKSLD